MTISRRDLFGLFRGGTPASEVASGDEPQEVARPASPPAELAGPVPEAPVGDIPAAGFSLDAFYAGRTAERVLPPFAIRATVATPTTRVGGGRTQAVKVSAAAPAIAPDHTTPIPLGLVPEVLAHRCLATTSFCSVCVERCPIPGAIVVALGRPRVEASLCDGCGHCVAGCPAPILAFALVARPVEKGSS